MQKAKSKLSPRVINPHEMHLHNSLSNVAIARDIHMPCINIHPTGRYQLEIVFVHAYLRLQWVNTAQI